MTDTPTTTTGGRALAIAAGCVFVAGTLGILFEDVVLKGAPLALKHGLTLAILSGTIMAGHLANSSWKSRHWLSCSGFVLVFIAGTALVIYSSVGRQAAASIQTESQIEESNARRADIKRDRAKAQAMLDKALGDYATECKTGVGKRCDGIHATIDVYQAAIKGHDADLDKIGAPKTAAPEAEQFAEVAHVVFGADKAKVKAAAILVAPFLITLFLEFGTIVSLGYAFAPRRQAILIQRVPLALVAATPPQEALPAPVSAVQTEPVAVEPSAPIVAPLPPKRPRGGVKRRTAFTQSRALADLLTLTAMGKTVESQDWLAERWQRDKSTISKWLAKWEAKDLVSRVRVGPYKATEAA